jgi:hypothetical protein
VGPPFRHSAAVFHSVFSPDGRRIVTASADRTAQVWETPSGRRMGPALRHGDTVRQAVFSPDGRRIVTASDDRTARIWDATTGKALTPPLEHSMPVWTAAFSPDGRQVITANGPEGSSERGEARIWDVLTGKPTAPPLKHQRGVRSARFSPDGRRIVTASLDGTARVWEARTGRPVTPPLRHEHGVTHASFSPDGRFVATASEDYTARVWDAATGEPVTPPFQHDYTVWQVEFSPDGRRLLTAVEAFAAWLWELAPRQPSPSDLLPLTRLLTSRQLDATGGIGTVESAALRKLWPEMRARYPESFAARPEHVLAWHRQEATACEGVRMWVAAIPHLDALIETEPSVRQHRDRRARAYAELSQWENVSREYQDLIELGEDTPAPYVSLAVAQLAAGDTDGYRRTYAALRDQFGQREDRPADPYLVALVSVLLPGTDPDPGRPRLFAERALAAAPSNYDRLSALGGVLFRAARFEDAARRLMEADAVLRPEEGGMHFFWLAMSHARLGHAVEARDWLGKARQWHDQALQRKLEENPLSWDQRVILQHLRREAEALIPSQPSPGR